jgi:hypothetical protein
MTEFAPFLLLFSLRLPLILNVLVVAKLTKGTFIARPTAISELSDILDGARFALASIMFCAAKAPPARHTG